MSSSDGSAAVSDRTLPIACVAGGGGRACLPVAASAGDPRPGTAQRRCRPRPATPGKASAR